MNIRISTSTKGLDEHNRSIKGYAKINFDNRFVLDNVTIRESKNGDLYVKMPQMSVIHQENGIRQRIEVDSFYPKTKEARAELESCILHLFKENDNGAGVYVVDSEIKMGEVKAHEFNKGATIGKASIDLGDFVLPAVYIQKTKNGVELLNYTATLRRYPDKNDGTIEERYTDNFKPITKEDGQAFRSACLEAYHSVLGQQQRPPLDLTRKSNGRK